MAYIIILIGALLRVLPHAANFAPIGALALFGGVYLNRRVALLVPLMAMLISDFFIGFDSLQQRSIVYGSFLLIGLVGMLIRRKKNVATVVSGSLAASAIFFLVTNCVYLYSPDGIYGHTWAEQVRSYTNALPFLKPTLVSDLMYTGIFFGSYELVKAWARRKSHAIYNPSPR
ncbi:MAG: hypothetical protein KW788_01800 [Candidatus Doudnabacteria bacterium]|nr:hypothetical protein [Candidatus Doudnabacteria bacterium]